MKDERKFDKKVFHKQLVFTRDENTQDKIATFVDKKGNNAKVITTWGRVIPGLRYSCRLEVPGIPIEGEDCEPTVLYKMSFCRLWVDNLQVVSGEGVVDVTLEDKAVDALRFGEGVSTDVESKVEELLDYFKEKTFQLACREDIDTFIQVYKEKCEEAYKRISKSVPRKGKLKGDRICL